VPAVEEILLSVSSKGQVTIPVRVRRLLGVEKRGKVALVIDEKKGDFKLRKPRYPDLESVRGAAGTLRKKVSWKKMLEIAHEDALRGKI
jgi:bifunctional DNA-binding transcriptional regulator/antitoxin component of YhaV-PrlF toxin-antitoxin module